MSDEAAPHTRMRGEEESRRRRRHSHLGVNF